MKNDELRMKNRCLMKNEECQNDELRMKNRCLMKNEECRLRL